MSGARATTQDGRKRGFFHVNGSIAEVDFVWRWPEQQIYPSLSTNLFILGLRPRVFVEIRTRLELERIAKIPGTKVILMGVERIREIAESLIANGLPADTPIGMVRWSTTGRQPI